MGSCCTQKICLMKVPSESLKNLRGEVISPPKIEEIHFLMFLGAKNFPLIIFSNSEGTFIGQTSWVQQHPIEKKIEKFIILGVNWEFRFLDFFKKPKTLKCALFDQKRKNKDGFGKEMKSLPYKSAFIFAQKCTWG